MLNEVGLDSMCTNCGQGQGADERVGGDGGREVDVVRRPVVKYTLYHLLASMRIWRRARVQSVNHGL